MPNHQERDKGISGICGFVEIVYQIAKVGKSGVRKTERQYTSVELVPSWLSCWSGDQQRRGKDKGISRVCRLAKVVYQIVRGCWSGDQQRQGIDLRTKALKIKLSVRHLYLIDYKYFD